MAGSVKPYRGASIRIEGPQRAVSRIVAVSCSEIRGPRSVFLANQVLDLRILVKWCPEEGFDALPRTLVRVQSCNNNMLAARKHNASALFWYLKTEAVGQMRSW
jgi:hypothetical protein